MVINDAGFEALLRLMRDNPAEFRQGQFTLVHKPSRAEVWTCNGFWFYALYEPQRLPFGFLQKCRFHAALKRWRKADTSLVDLLLGPDAAAPAQTR